MTFRDAVRHERGDAVAGGAGETPLPGLDCGLCGYRTCGDLAGRLKDDPTLVRRCIPLVADDRPGSGRHATMRTEDQGVTWRDGLDREFDFFLEHFPEDVGPREIIRLHNPQLVRDLDVSEGDTLIGRPLGMSCGCPITHCGTVTGVDHRNGIITWCVTGPLGPRQNGFKDVGYYSAEAYEGIVRLARCEIRIGMRYFFQPRMCMLQWRHSGLVNYANRARDGIQVRLEGLWIG